MEPVNLVYTAPMKWDQLRAENCPVARALSVVGDRWTMLVVRDCFLGFRRFDKIQARLGLTRHVLADRLRKLEAAGVLRRQQYQDRPPRFEYHLTDAGEALFPTLVSLITWAEEYAPSDEMSEITLTSRATGQAVDPLLTDARDGEVITNRTVAVRRNRPSALPD